MKIIIDADACPKGVLEISFDLGQRYEVPVWTVASFNHRIQSAHHFVVGDGPDEADLKVLNLTAQDDVVITQDWGLAAMVLGKGARCLSPGGREYRPEKIDFLLEERAAKARYRRSGGRTKGPQKRTRQNDRAFARALTGILRRAPAQTDK